MSRFTVALCLGLAACTSSPSLAWHREKSFVKDFAVEAAAEDFCARYCEKATDHDRSKCGEATCDRHEHRVGAWNLSPFDVAAVLEAWGKEFADEVEPQAPAPVRGTIAETVRKQAPQVAAEFRSAALQAVETQERRSETTCNTEATSRWTCTFEVKLHVTLNVRVTGTAEDPVVRAEVHAFTFAVGLSPDVSTTYVNKGDCPCAPK